MSRKTNKQLTEELAAAMAAIEAFTNNMPEPETKASRARLSEEKATAKAQDFKLKMMQRYSKLMLVEGVVQTSQVETSSTGQQYSVLQIKTLNAGVTYERAFDGGTMAKDADVGNEIIIAGPPRANTNNSGKKDKNGRLIAYANVNPFESDYCQPYIES